MKGAWNRLWTSPIHRKWAEVMQPLMNLTADGIVDAGELTEIFHLEITASNQKPAKAAAKPAKVAAKKTPARPGKKQTKPVKKPAKSAKKLAKTPAKSVKSNKKVAVKKSKPRQ